MIKETANRNKLQMLSEQQPDLDQCLGGDLFIDKMHCYNAYSKLNHKKESVCASNLYDCSLLTKYQPALGDREFCTYP